jgi:hypothetical protein
MAAAARQADRDNQRRRKIATKQQMIASAASAVAEWEGYTESLSRISLQAGDPIDWKAIAIHGGKRDENARRADE